VKFFKEVRQLLVKGFNPKFDLIDEHVTTIDIARIFGRVHKFKTTNPLLSMETRTKLERFYWRIYKTTRITNNELMAWLVRGWVAQRHGHQIN
jgi:hypothetical protein